jgi:integrase
LNGNLKIKELKEDEMPVKSLNDIQIKKLLTTASPYPALKMRILLALGTGLRRGDIESLQISDIDFVKNHITTTSRKTRKSTGARPVPAEVIAELKKYLNGFNTGQVKIFNDNFSHKRWKRICKDAGLSDLKFNDLRKTFGSMLAQNGVSTAVTQRLLEHSSPTLTNKIYTNVDPVLRQSVNQLPIEQWLEK